MGKKSRQKKVRRLLRPMMQEAVGRVRRVDSWLPDEVPFDEKNPGPESTTGVLPNPPQLVLPSAADTVVVQASRA